MSIQIGNYHADGPFGNVSGLLARSGVYVILGRTGQTNWNVVDIGESGNITNASAATTGNRPGSVKVTHNSRSPPSMPMNATGR
ncbi:MAG: hypothetical protein AB7I36_19850 [Rhodospirillaceae bacterium]